MLTPALVTLLTCVSVARCGIDKTLRNLPVISNSLVNLGHMDISLNIHPSRQDLPSKSQFESQFQPLIQNDPEIERSCTCSRQSTSPFSNSRSNLFSKILSSNTFSFFDLDKEPIMSAMCCESHERTGEETLILEFGQNPKATPTKPQSNVMKFPNLVFDTIVPKPRDISFRPTEFFYYPNQKANLSGKKVSLSADIKVVGDKKLTKNLKTFKYQPSVPENSVKKDLTNSENLNVIDVTQNHNTGNDATTAVADKSVDV